MANPSEFTKQYGAIAKAAGERLKVDPQILLGQWGLETGWGKSVVPGTNNLGNIKDFTGGGVGAVDNMTGSNDKYRTFDTPEAFADHFSGLIERKYPAAIGAGEDSLKFAQALKAGGYAEDPAYIRKMVNVTNTVRKTPGVMDMLASAVFPAAQASTLPAKKPPLDMSQVKFLDAPGAAPLTPGNIDLGNRPVVPNADGSISTVRSISINMDGKEYLIPTVSDDGRIMQDEEAIQAFERSGKHLGVFADNASATAYANSLHDSQAKMYGQGGASKPALDMSQVKWLDQPAGPGATTEQEILASVPGRILKGIKDPIDAGAQMLVHALPGGLVDSVNSGVQAVNDIPVIGQIAEALGIKPANAAQVDQGIANDEKVYQAARAATGSDGLDLSRLGGNVIGTAPLAVSPAAGASLAARTATGALSGAGFGMAQPVTEGDYADEKLKQAGLGAAMGGIAAPITAGVARLVSPKASVNPQIQKLLNEGITPTPGQLVGGTAQRMEDKAVSLPILGDAIVSARNRGTEQFNRAALNRALAPLGKDLNSIGRGGIKEVGETISQAYDDLLPKLSFRADNAFATDLARIQSMATELPEAQANQLQRIMQDKVLGKLTPQGFADGINYKQIESELGRMATNYLSATDADQRTLGAAISEVQKSLRETLTRSNPSMAKELGKINEAYSIFTRIQRAAGGVGAEGGVFTPAQLQSAVRAGDSSMRKGRFAKGEAVLQDLAEAGKTVMGGKVPNSGTADRMFAGAGALASGAISPAIPGSLIGASVPYLPGVSNAVAAAIARRPAGAQDAAALIRSMPPGVMALFGNLQ